VEALGILGFIFGLVAFVRVEKLIRELKANGTLGADYKADE